MSQVSDFLTFSDADDGALFEVKVLNTGEVRTCRYQAVGPKWPRFVDPERPDDYRRWLTDGWGARVLRHVSEGAS